MQLPMWGWAEGTLEASFTIFSRNSLLKFFFFLDNIELALIMALACRQAGIFTNIKRIAENPS